jgi:DNA-binding NarL/FixJ family response regulator
VPPTKIHRSGQTPSNKPSDRSNPKFNIAIIEQDVELRRALSEFFAASARLDCVLAVDSIEKFVKYHRDFLAIDLVLLDEQLHDASGIEGVPLIRQREPKAEIIIYSSLDDSSTILRAFSRGATGYLLKGYSFEELEQKLLGSLEGNSVLLSPDVARKLIGYFHPVQLRELPDQARISERENLVIQLLIDGLSYQEIATKMGITLNGVRQHVYNIYRKLKINKRHQLIQLKERGGLRG